MQTENTINSNTYQKYTHMHQNTTNIQNKHKKHPQHVRKQSIHTHQNAANQEEKTCNTIVELPSILAGACLSTALPTVFQNPVSADPVCPDSSGRR